MTDLAGAAQKTRAGERLSTEDARVLLDAGDLLTLGHLAHRARLARHPEPLVTFVVDRNINYTNICVSGCRFCAFYRPPGHPEGYVITQESLREKIQETVDLGGTQILLQGGMNPDLDIDDYCDLLRSIHREFDIHVHGFSPPEIAFIAKASDRSIEETLKVLMEAGLDSIPGGGAEILVDEVREQASPHKCSSGTWLQVMETAHQLGLRTTATMMFGHLESPRHIIQHMDEIRRLQDRTGGFTAFIPWTFQPANTEINVAPATSAEYLKVLALSRLYLDNIPNIQASWVTQGAKIAQVALAFGANDLGSTMIEENVVAAAGVSFRLPRSEMVRLIQTAGYRAVQRDCFYHHLKVEA